MMVQIAAIPPTQLATTMIAIKVACEIPPEEEDFESAAEAVEEDEVVDDDKRWVEAEASVAREEGVTIDTTVGRVTDWEGSDVSDELATFDAVDSRAGVASAVEEEGELTAAELADEVCCCDSSGSLEADDEDDDDDEEADEAGLSAFVRESRGDDEDDDAAAGDDAEDASVPVAAAAGVVAVC